MKTIAKSRAAFITDLFARATNVQGRDLSSGFAAWDTTAEYVKAELFRYSFAKLTEDGTGTYTVKVHNNCWYTFSAAQ